MMNRFLSLTALCSLCSLNLLFSQNFTLSGYVKDGRSGETITGVNVYNKTNPQQGASTNNYGFYSLTMPKGTYTVKISFVGYADREIEVNLSENTQKNVELTEGVELQAVVVTAEPKDKNVSKTEMGTVVLAIENIKRLPVLFGEADVLKVIQLLPGVKATEGSSGFYVRGGGIDQNLILLDEAVVYNPGHLLGFFSIFNADAIKNLTLIKGGMPAQYGGRLSSVVDIQMKEGNNQSFGAEGGIGLIASRLTLQGPIQKNKSSFIVSARRTYALDLAQSKINETKFAGSNYYFYDMNLKANYQFSERDRIYLSAYFGRDVFLFNSAARGFNFRLPYGNATSTLRWNHVFNPKLFLNVSGIYNDYNFEAGGGQDVFSFKAFSGVRDFNGKVDFDYYPSVKHSIKFGMNYTFHRLTPNIVTASNSDTIFTNANLIKPKFANEFAFYFGDDWKVSSALTLNVGARFSAFQQLGPYKSPKTNIDFPTNKVVTNYSGFEPRVTGTYKFDAQSSLKFGVTATTQYLHLVSNSTSSFPSDIWVPSSEYIKPQRGLQYAAGFFRNFKENQWETSVEVYYKELKNQIDYPESYVNNATNNVEQSYVFGKGKAYGAEFFIKKAKGRLNGWLGYTWSRTLREFPDINGGKAYPSTYDRIHDVVLVANYQFSKKWEGSGNFTFATGNTFTPLRNLYTIDQKLRLEYGDRNSLRLPNYNRMDLGVTYTPKPEAKGFKSSWTFSVYNVYNRWNPFFIQYDIQSSFEKGTAKATAFAVTLFPIIPSVTWNFKWQQTLKKDVLPK
jgi:outer membrane receptor for ferrienterochelin and colicin